VRWENYWSEVLLLEEYDRKIGLVGRFGIGAPAAATVLEELIAVGVQEFISIGSAGSLQKHVQIGDAVVCEQAICGEGVSRHYLTHAECCKAGTGITTRIKAALEGRSIAHHSGTTWTTDAPYRETIEEVRQHQAENVLAVEMEAAALFAVAQFRGVELGAALAIGDSLADLKWHPDFLGPVARNGLKTIYSVAVQALAQGLG
jgi:uridine phosphorylase